MRHRGRVADIDHRRRLAIGRRDEARDEADTHLRSGLEEIARRRLDARTAEVHDVRASEEERASRAVAARLAAAEVGAARIPGIDGRAVAVLRDAGVTTAADLEAVEVSSGRRRRVLLTLPGGQQKTVDLTAAQGRALDMWRASLVLVAGRGDAGLDLDHRRRAARAADDALRDAGADESALATAAARLRSDADRQAVQELQATNDERRAATAEARAALRDADRAIVSAHRRAEVTHRRVVDARRRRTSLDAITPAGWVRALVSGSRPQASAGEEHHQQHEPPDDRRTGQHPHP